MVKESDPSREDLLEDLKRRLREDLEKARLDLDRVTVSRYDLDFESLPRQDVIDFAFDCTEQVMLRALESHFRRVYSQLRAAVQRIEKGEYGICENCGRQISLQRLAVLPSASRCIECQTHYEHERKLRR